MTARKKPSNLITKRGISHYCIQEKTVARMSLILLGNGNPEDGIAYKVLAMHDNIQSIKEIVNNLHERAEENAKVASSAVSALELYKVEMTAIDKGMMKTEEVKEKKLKQWLEVIGLFFIAVGLLVTILLGLKDDLKMNKIESQLENLGVPIVTRKGEVMSLPRDAKIKFFPQDFTDTIKTKK